MIRKDFVSNSSSSSFIVSLDKDEYTQMVLEPITFLGLILREKDMYLYEFPKPCDERKSEFRLQDYNQNPRNVDLTKYEWLICPLRSIYENDYRISDVNILKEYMKCCDICMEKDCNKQCKKIYQKMINELEENKIVIVFKLGDGEMNVISDDDFARVKDKHVILYERFH